MANDNNIGGIITTDNSQIIANGLRIPPGFNDNRGEGELSNLLNYNSDIIYSKYSNKTGYTGLLKFGPRQPFIEVNINNANKGLNALKKYEGRAMPIASSLIDVERLTKWSLTGDGLIYLAKQFFLQGQNAFNETKLYNPLSPILASVSRASFGAIPTPTRFIDFSSIGAFFGYGGSDNAPSGTVGKGAISDIAKLSSNPYKGLLRGATASSGYQTMNQKWTPQKQSGNMIANYFKSGINKIFGSFMPVGQPENTTYKADENSYGLMLGAKDKFKYGDDLKWGSDFFQRWEAGSNTESVKLAIKKKKETSIDDSKKLITVMGKKIPTTSKYYDIPVGYTIKDNSKGYKTYGDNVGILPSILNKTATTTYEYSDLLSIYVEYTRVNTNDKVKSESKFNDKDVDSVKEIQKNLQAAIDGIKSAGYDYLENVGGIQQFSDQYSLGMDNITKKTKKPFDKTKNPKNYNGGYMTGFRFYKSKQLLDDPSGLGFSGTNTQDKLNLLEIVSVLDNLKIDGNGNEYIPYESDQIAFFFKDLVNEKIVPFRATVKGISESLTAEWNDVSYIGTADKLYSYKGFMRALTFSFHIHVNSIKELLPVWKRINYFCGFVKPSNYTGNGERHSFSRFIIPPLIEVNIGDLYKNQPGIITSINLSVPEDASWETLAESTDNNYNNNDKDWNYLNGSIIWKKSKGKYAQFPRSVDINVSMNLLEKERPVIGGSQFGHVYRDIDFKNKKSAGDFSSNLMFENINI